MVLFALYFLLNLACFLLRPGPCMLAKGQPAAEGDTTPLPHPPPTAANISSTGFTLPELPSLPDGPGRARRQAEETGTAGNSGGSDGAQSATAQPEAAEEAAEGTVEEAAEGTAEEAAGAAAKQATSPPPLASTSSPTPAPASPSTTSASTRISTSPDTTSPPATPPDDTTSPPATPPDDQTSEPANNSSNNETSRPADDQCRCSLWQYNNVWDAVRWTLEMLVFAFTAIYVLGALNEARFLGVHMFVENLVSLVKRGWAKREVEAG